MLPKKAKAPIVFESVSNPTLKRLDPINEVRFFQERETYEIEIEERDRDGAQVASGSYRVSHDNIFLRSV